MIALAQRLSYQFQREDLLIQAMTHKSFAYEHKEHLSHNEKLEFLGDAVIDLVLGDFLMELFPSDDEGSLSKKRASLVNEDSLAGIARAHDLALYLRLGKGESLSGGSTKPRLLSSAWEALTGAIFLDGGFDKTREILRREFRPLIEKLDPQLDYATDYKTRVQEIAQKNLKTTPVYELVSEEGPPHDRLFTVSLKVKDAEIAKGTGRSKKAAEQQAAREGLENIGTKDKEESK